MHNLGLDPAIVSYIVKRPRALAELQGADVNEEHFVNEYKKVWRFIARIDKQYGNPPSRGTLESRFSQYSYTPTREKDLPYLIAELKKRKKWWDFLEVVNYAATNAATPDEVDDVIQTVQAKVNELAYGSNGSALVDFFSSDTTERIKNDLDERKRNDGVFASIPTGLKTLDSRLGGLQKIRMVVLAGRLASGKTAINLLFTVRALMAGRSVLLYPLEMTVEETAYRLYSLLSQTMLGNDKVFKNTGLNQGNVSRRELGRFLKILEEKFEGRLHVADMGSFNSSYTLERIEAEVDLHRPDMFWVDYLTLLKAPPGHKAEHTGIRELSNGIKRMAMKYKCLGGCSAQINRDAMNRKAFLPQPESLALGDSIGQDADLIVSMVRKDQYLYYGVVKNRHGEQFGPVRTKFFPDLGIIEEHDDQSGLEEYE